MGPDIRASTLQFVPNWNAMTMPETTPSPNATPKILSQNSNTSLYAGRPVHRLSASSTVSQAANPIVKRDSWVDVKTQARPGEKAKLSDLLAALKQLNVPVQDQISILEMLHKSGKLQAKSVKD